MKYIIETEMPLTEVYVRVSQEEFSRLRLNTNVSKKDWVHSSSGWLKPLPVSPMKEVGEDSAESRYNSITQWQDKVFTKATPLSCVNHLEEEVGELKKDIEAGKYSFDEIADCFLLLFGVSNKCGLSFQDIMAALDAKMEVNYKRTWGQPNEKGYVKHIEESK